jgi:hypothetical protein
MEFLILRERGLIEKIQIMRIKRIIQKLDFGNEAAHV